MLNSLPKILSSLLLLFNGIGALYGGGSLIIYPDGSGISLPLALLEHTPFADYLIPGIVLFAANGISSLLIFSAIVFNLDQVDKLIVLQGCLLLGWLTVQVVLIRTFYPLQLIMGLTGLMMIVLGLLLSRNKKNVRPVHN